MTSPGDDMRIACNGLTGRDLSERSIGRRPSVGWEGGLTIVPHAVEYRAVNVGGNWSTDIRKKYEASGTLDAHDLGRIASYKGILDWGSCHNLYVKVLKDLDEAAQAQFAAERAAKHKYVVIQ
jgi:hypothetical protein